MRSFFVASPAVQMQIWLVSWSVIHLRCTDQAAFSGICESVYCLHSNGDVWGDRCPRLQGNGEFWFNYLTNIGFDADASSTVAVARPRPVFSLGRRLNGVIGLRANSMRSAVEAGAWRQGPVTGGCLHRREPGGWVSSRPAIIARPPAEGPVTSSSAVLRGRGPVAETGGNRRSGRRARSPYDQRLP